MAQESQHPEHDIQQISEHSDVSEIQQDPQGEGQEGVGQPFVVLEHGQQSIHILGTAHVSKASAEEVTRCIRDGDYDAVAIELDEGRFANISNPDNFAKMDLFKVIREGKAGTVAASLALGSFQQRLADQFGIESGAEMRAAIAEAKAKDLPLWLIDREIGLTLRRVYANVPWWQRMNIFGGLIASVLSREEIKEEDIEKLKEGDMLESTFREFAEQSESIFTPLISERDHYMAIRIREELTKAANVQKVLVVIGAGHLKGMAEHLNEGHSPESLGAQKTNLLSKPKQRPWWKVIPWLIVAIILMGFIIGFSRNQELGWTIVRDWVFINGTLAALGALIATAHPLTIIGSFFAAPLTSINPLIGAGYVGAGLELWLRKPTVGDFHKLRTDVTEMRGWWRNRVARTLLVFFLVTAGSAAGTYIAGARIFSRLFG